MPRLKIREMRGTALSEQKMPIILVNGKDRGNGRVFTLLHEFCHLALRQSGVTTWAAIGMTRLTPMSRNSATLWQPRRRCRVTGC